MSHLSDLDFLQRPPPATALGGRYGAAGNPLADLLGASGAAAVEDILQSPTVQANLERYSNQCKEQAKVGVIEVVRDYWYFAAGAVVFVGFVQFAATAVGVDWILGTFERGVDAGREGRRAPRRARSRR